MPPETPLFAGSPADLAEPTRTMSSSAARPRLWRRFGRNRTAVASLLILAVLVAVSVVGGLFYPYDHTELTKDFSRAPSSGHWMGTDAIGHDLFAQVLHGTRQSLRIAALVAIVATSIGVLLGTVAGYYRGWTDTILSRLTDLILVVPILAVLLPPPMRSPSRPAHGGPLVCCCRPSCGRVSRWWCAARS